MTGIGELVGFWVFVCICFAVFCIGVVLAVVAWHQIKRDDVLVVSSQIDRESILKYLRLNDSHKNSVDKEIEVRSSDD